MRAKHNKDQGQQTNELPLILFTLLTPMSLGMSTFALLCGSGLVFALMTGLFVLAGMIASIAHLARPLRAAFSILHWKTSWLSREILAVSAYFGLVVLWCLAAFFTRDARTAASFAALIMNVFALVGGIVLLFVIARAYRVSPIPAWDGGENVLELFAVALGPGVAFAAAAKACLIVFAEGGTPASFAVLGGDAAHASSLPYLPFEAILLIAIALLVLGCLLDILAYRRRLLRLRLADDSSVIVRARANYDMLYPKLRLCCILNIIGIVVAVLSLFFIGLSPLFVIIWICIAIVELVSQCIARSVFYGLHTQERSLARLRK